LKWRNGNTNDSFSIDIGAFILDRGIAIADITEATFMVKTNRADSDGSALATLTIANAQITKVPAVGDDPDQLALSFIAADFGTGVLEITSPPYYMGVGIKTASMTTFLEADLKDDRLTIFADFIHDN